VLDALPVTKTNSIKALKESQGMTTKTENHPPALSFLHPTPDSRGNRSCSQTPGCSKPRVDQKSSGWVTFHAHSELTFSLTHDYTAILPVFL